MTGTLPGAGAAGMALKGSRTYNAAGLSGNDPTPHQLATWTETWELLPTFQDGATEKPKPKLVENDCSFSPPAPGSIIGCENQSLGTATPSAASGFLIASEDGRLVYEFDAGGFHARTLNALTGTAVLSFTHDPKGGWLLSVADGSNNVTTFNRNAQGKLTTIAGPYGQISVATLNKQGYITSLKDPAGKSIKAKYSPKGLLTAFTNARGMASRLTYDAQDRLLSYGNIKYGYSANGEVNSRIVGRDKITFEYNLRGNLAAAVFCPRATALTIWWMAPASASAGKSTAACNRHSCTRTASSRLRNWMARAPSSAASFTRPTSMFPIT
ncbi:MAG: RHS repeat protein [Nitrospinae bacterium]|nr:RHS repeat protein [Nitrospinota bacterium]